MNAVLITGSSRGLGRELALVFAQNGHPLIIHGRDAKRLEEVKNEVESCHVACDVIRGDLREDSTLTALAAKASQGNISLLINNAAIMSKGPVESLSDAEIDEVLAVNLAAPLKLTSKIYPLFAKKGEGMIININSTDGLETLESHSLYSAAKTGLRAFTEGVRKDGLKHNVRVLSVHPAGMQTEFHKRVGGHKDYTLCMSPGEGAEHIFQLSKGGSVRTDLVVFNRKRSAV